MKRSLYPVLGLVMVLSLLLSSCGQATTAKPTAVPTTPTKVKITVGTDATYPPFEILDETTKQVAGFDIDLMNAIAEAAGFEVEYVNVPFDPLLTGLAACQYDAGVSAITIKAERLENMLFSEPYINAGQIVVVHKDNTTIKGKDDLAGLVIGAQIATTSADEAALIPNAEVRTYDAYELAFFDLANKQIDAVIADYPTAYAFVARASDKIKVVGEVFTSENYGIAVCKTKPEILALINDGLAKVKASGKLAEIEAKWLTAIE